MGKNSSTWGTKVADFVLKNNKAIIVFNLLMLLFVFGGMGRRVASFLKYNNYVTHIQNNPMDIDPAVQKQPPILDVDYRVFFESDNPELMSYDTFQEVYSREDNLIVVIKSANGEIFTNENLTTLQELTESFWTVPFVSRVDGLTNFNYVKADGDDIAINEFIAELPYTQEELAAKKAEAMADPLLSNFLVSKEGNAALIVLQINSGEVFQDQASMQTRNSVEEKIASIVSPNKDLSVNLSGTIMLNTEFAVAFQKDAMTLQPIMYLIIALILYILFRNVWGVVLPLAVLFTSVFFPIGLFVGVFEYSINNINMNVMQMLLGIAIADSIHILSYFYKSMRKGMDKEDALRDTIARNIIPCLITSVTTAIGFYSLMYQTVPPFKDLGLFAGTGTIYALFASVFTMPAILKLLPVYVPVAAVKKGPAKTESSIMNFVIQNRTGIRTVSLAILVLLAFNISKINVDNTPVSYFDKEGDFRIATEYIDNNIVGTNTFEFSFDAGRAEGIYSPEYLANIDRFTSYLTEKSEYGITYVSSVVDIVKRMNKSMHGDDPSYYRIPTKADLPAEDPSLTVEDLISQYILLYTLSLPRGMDLTNQIALDYSESRVIAYQKTFSSWEQMAMIDEINQWLDTEMPAMGAQVLGQTSMWARLFKRSVPGMINSLIISIVCITLALIITFRSVKIGLLSMIPNVLPIVIVFGLLGYFGITVNLAISAIGMIVLGVVVDDTVHFLFKYLTYKREGIETEVAIHKTYIEVVQPIVFTSVILILGFGLLAFSSFVPNFMIGVLCTSVILLALIADLFVLPTFMYFKRTSAVVQRVFKAVPERG